MSIGKLILSNTRALRRIILMSTAQSPRGIDVSRFKYINDNERTVIYDRRCSNDRNCLAKSLMIIFRDHLPWKESKTIWN